MDDHFGVIVGRLHVAKVVNPPLRRSRLGFFVEHEIDKLIFIFLLEGQSGPRIDFDRLCGDNLPLIIFHPYEARIVCSAS